MNIKQAQYIQTIANEGSITAAAKKLYISQPSLSQMVRQVEKELGVALFDRTSLPLRLTYAGEKYLECAHTMIVANDRLENQLQDIRQENSGHLRLGISVQRGMRILPQAMPKFINRYPNVSLELRETGSVRMEDLLRYGEIDLAFAALESTSARFDYRLIEKETTGILVGKSSRLAERFASGTPIALTEAGNEQFVSLKQGHSIRVVQDQLFRMLDIDPKILMEVDSLEMAKRVTVSCGACMLCPDIYFDETVIKQGVFYPIKGVENNRHFYACWRKGENLPRYAEDLIEIVTGVLDGRKAWEI
ncbi:MAG: LysR family transcriptional regulator [Lachnospiraceae bacterium]|nr:LysR family transcriptional regulator [Lachnospiraceae bacterium]